MNIKVISFYEDHWMPPATDHAQWDHLCRAYGVDLQMVRSWDDVIIPEGAKVILLDEAGMMDLAEIGDIDNAINSDNIVLVFGRTAQDLTTNLPEGSWDFAFRITTPNAIPMFGVNACAIALFALEQWVKMKAGA